MKAKKSEETLLGICDAFANGKATTYTGACRAADISKRTFWTWMKDEALTVEYQGVRMPFASAIDAACRAGHVVRLARPDNRSRLPVGLWIWSKSCALYRHFDAAGVLLYVGVTRTPNIRLANHLLSSNWRDLITTITIERFLTRVEAVQAETTAIRTERPLYNRIGADPQWLDYVCDGIADLY